MSRAADTCLNAVRDALQSAALTPAGPPILAAVSGGPDSVALLHLLVELGYPAEVAHFDHRTRDGASAEDARFVEALANQLDLPVHVRAEDVAVDAEASPLSFEEFARERRYAFLIETAIARRCAAVATGHHAGDQAETVLMRILRGTTSRGLGGIPPTTERDGFVVVRPLLHVRRADILAYLDERGHAYRSDETNFEMGFVRNRIRHRLLPQLAREYNPRIADALNRLADVHRLEDELLQSLTDDFERQCMPADGVIARDAFATGPPALQRRLLLNVAWRFGIRPDFEHIERAVAFVLESGPHKRFDLGGNIQLAASDENVAVAPLPNVPPDTTAIPLAVPGDTDAFGARLHVSYLDAPPSQPLAQYCTPTRQVVDADALNGAVQVRFRRPGDRIAPLGLGGTRKLKDYFSDLGIPPEERDRKLLVVANGDILWIVGHAVSQHAAVTDATKRIAQIEVLHEA